MKDSKSRTECNFDFSYVLCILISFLSKFLLIGKEPREDRNSKLDFILKNRLAKLQKKFDKGHELKVIHMPNEYRETKHGLRLSGELQNDFIIIYETDERGAIRALNHEFIEYILAPLLQNYVDLINNQNKVITKLLYEQKESIIESLCKSID